jgi:hypothetical protein
MRQPAEHQSELYGGHTDFWLRLQWLDSEQIMLALAESFEDSRRHSLSQRFLWETITGEELLNFHRQLFMWRLVRVKIPDGHSLSN